MFNSLWCQWLFFWLFCSISFCYWCWLLLAAVVWLRLLTNLAGCSTPCVLGVCVVTSARCAAPVARPRTVAGNLRLTGGAILDIISNHQIFNNIWDWMCPVTCEDISQQLISSNITWCHNYIFFPSSHVRGQTRPPKGRSLWLSSALSAFWPLILWVLSSPATQHEVKRGAIPTRHLDEVQTTPNCPPLCEISP